MAYYIIVNDDDTLYGSHKERLMQRQKLVNDLIFIVDPIYRNTHDMTNASVLLEYVLPVSRKYETVYLTLCDERYNGCFLQYKLPFDVSMTSESGEVEMQLTFAWTELDLNGNGIQRVRKTSSTFINIVPVTAWSDIVPDEALSALDQRLIKLDASMRAMNDYMNILESNKVDNLVYDDKNEELYLSAKGEPVGNKIQVKDMIEDGVPVIDLNSSYSPEEPDVEGDEDNVVEF